MAKKMGGLGKGLGAIFIENDNEENGGAVKLKISEIEPNRSQPRKDFDEEALGELADSIAKHGLLQPILVRPLTLGGYEIVAGERRYRASRMAGLTEVPVIIRELTESETMELALIENLQREDLSPLEEAQGYNVLISEHGFTQEEVAKSVGKSRPAVANALRLLKLPESIAAYLKEDKISAGHARALLTLPNEEIMQEVCNQIIKNDFSVRQTEKICKKLTAEAKPVKKEKEKIPNFYKEVIQDIIPAVEMKYNTYLTDPSAEGIKATRDHRAFTGYSRGSV
ncbi:MAG: ParB/RepB/Spo0J family partition protein, partial [Ruminococcus sp.]|nr:ParB/RepB/Spo0J family partition protein [Ruminococcus sp.]